MYAQGKSLGKQLGIWANDLEKIVAQNPGRVWFMGRDMDVFYVAFCETGYDVKYLVGLNRDNARKLAHRGRLEHWLRSVGVKDGDILIDSGYRGSIFARIAETTGLNIYFLLLTADPEGSTGVAVNEALNTPQTRRIILALEHSPKREVCVWDEDNRRPKTTRLGGKDGQRASEFLHGCTYALEEAIMR